MSKFSKSFYDVTHSVNIVFSVLLTSYLFEQKTLCSSSSTLMTTMTFVPPVDKFAPQFLEFLNNIGESTALWGENGTTFIC